MYVHYQSNSIPEPLEVECSQGGTPKVGYWGLWVGVISQLPLVIWDAREWRGRKALDR